MLCLYIRSPPPSVCPTTVFCWVFFILFFDLMFLMSVDLPLWTFFTSVFTVFGEWLWSFIFFWPFISLFWPFFYVFLWTVVVPELTSHIFFHWEIFFDFFGLFYCVYFAFLAFLLSLFRFFWSFMSLCELWSSQSSPKCFGLFQCVYYVVSSLFLAFFNVFVLLLWPFFLCNNDLPHLLCTPIVPHMHILVSFRIDR